MNLHIVGGFLGSGKTTAIISAAKTLIQKGQRVGVITNDKGKNLVDTAFFENADIPTAEIPGGCFRCSFDDLQKLLEDLENQQHPDVIFAESVGSCVDLAATVLKPLLDLKTRDEGLVSLSVFTDIRLLRRWLLKEELPFSEEVVYMFEKQIEEAQILIINKIDLLSKAEVAETLQLAEKAFPEKKLIAQTSFKAQDVLTWLSAIEQEQPQLKEPIEIDYDIYNKGSQKLGWLDEKIQLNSPEGKAGTVLAEFISNCLQTLQEENIQVAHLKFFIRDQEQQIKISLTSLADDFDEQQLSSFSAKETEILVNGRIQTAPAHINRIITEALENCTQDAEIKYQRSETAYFRPKIIKGRE